MTVPPGTCVSLATCTAQSSGHSLLNLPDAPRTPRRLHVQAAQAHVRRLRRGLLPQEAGAEGNSEAYRLPNEMDKGLRPELTARSRRARNDKHRAKLRRINLLQLQEHSTESIQGDWWHAARS